MRQGTDGRIGCERPDRRTFLGGLAAGLLAASSGCITLMEGRNWRAPWTDRPPIGDVGRVEAFWFGFDEAPDPTNRGLPMVVIKGRIYLYTGNIQDELREGDGWMEVALFDDKQDAKATQPREVWRLDPKTLRGQFSKDSMLGWGYSMVLPWSNYRPDIKMVSLGVRYVAPDGQEYWSRWTRMAVGEGAPGRFDVQQSHAAAQRSHETPASLARPERP